MLKFLFDVFQVAILLRIIWAIGKYLLIRPKRRRSIVWYKLRKIISNAICSRLDIILEKQEAKKAAVCTQQPSGKVISIEKYRQSRAT